MSPDLLTVPYMAHQIKTYIWENQMITLRYKSCNTKLLCPIQQNHSWNQWIYQRKVQYLLTFYEKPSFLAEKYRSSFQGNATWQTGWPKALCPYKHVDTCLGCITITPVQTCLNSRRGGRQTWCNLFACHICTAELIWVKITQIHKLITHLI